MKKNLLSVVVPVYKNYEMFFSYLLKNSRYLENCELIVMNDYPQENITEKVKSIVRNARVFNNKKNLGFAGNVNRGILKSTRPFVMLLNSDVVLKNDSFLRCLDDFRKDKKLFAISFSQEEKNGDKVGANCGYFENGMVNHKRRLANSYTPNFWAEGGSSIFRKSILDKIGLLDNLYNPFYWEDIDLSYRAWKAGYRVMFDPRTVVRHVHESTIGKYFNRSNIYKTALRNQLIFQWKNLTDADLIREHVFAIFKLFVISVFKMDWIFLTALTNAILKLPEIIASRKKTIRLYIKTDKEILRVFKQ